jgi:hypothetical protein
MWNLSRLETAKKNILSKTAAEAEKANQQIESYKDRLVKVQEITAKQLELSDLVSQPSKNSLHSKYKNGINQEIKTLEEEKSAILKSIIKDGFDPSVAVLNADGVKETLKLSEYMARAGIDMEDDLDPNDPTVKKVGKFTVYKGGNSDTTH